MYKLVRCQEFDPNSKDLGILELQYLGSQSSWGRRQDEICIKILKMLTQFIIFCYCNMISYSLFISQFLFLLTSDESWISFHSFIFVHSFNNYFCASRRGPTTVLGAEYITVNRIDGTAAPLELTFQFWRQQNVTQP